MGALLVCSAALAYDGLTFGVNVHPANVALIDVHAVLPVLEVGGLQHAARADVAYGFGGGASVAATYLLAATPGDDVERYLGAGGGLSTAPTPFASPLGSLHALAGVRVPLVSRLHANGEITVTGSAVASGIGFAIGLEYGFGGAR